MGKRAGEEAAAIDAAELPSKKKGTNRLEAMNHPLRARVLRLLVERGVMSPAELSRTLRAELSDVSYHVRRLEKLECVELVDTRPVRGALEHFYRATERHLITTEEFDKLDPIVADDIVLNSFQRIVDDVVASRKAKMIGYDRHFYLARTPYIFDEQGYQEGMDLLERCREEMSEIERRSAERRVSGAPGVAASGSLLLFKVPNASLDT
ncbi:MAG TPA: helix-turn-helix domain-containing protein [Solirubrobacterales bacterium]|nr:helix-turn-helix domain-containing protein [Solirubrobacterales bacterium]